MNAPTPQQLSPEILMAMMTDPRSTPQQRMAAMSTLNAMKGQPASPAPLPNMQGDSTGISTMHPAFAAAVRDEVSGGGGAAPAAPAGNDATSALMSGAADANRVASMAHGGAVKGYARGGDVTTDLDPATMTGGALDAGAEDDPHGAWAMLRKEAMGRREPIDPQDKWMALLQAGLGTMAAASQPGATFLGSIGQGGLSGVQGLRQAQAARAEERMKNASLWGRIAEHEDTVKERKEAIQARLDERRNANLTPLAKLRADLAAGRINQDEFDAAVKKENYVPDFDPLNRSAKEASQWVETKDAFGNPLLVNKLTGDTKNPGGVQAVGEDEISTTAKQIANYKKRPPTGNAGRSPFWIAVMDRVVKENPDYDERFYNSSNAAKTAFAKGPEATLVRSASVAVGHLATLDALGQALDNGDTKLANTLKNKLSDEFGGVPIAGYDAASNVVGDEVAKFILGGRSALPDREKFAAPLTSARGNDARKSAINSFTGLLVGQLHGLKRQYETETKSKDFEEKLDPEVAKLLTNPQFNPPGTNPTVVPAALGSPAVNYKTADEVIAAKQAGTLDPAKAHDILVKQFGYDP